MLDNQALMRLVITTLENIKAENIISIPVSALTTITDTMIICTGNSARHVKAIAQHLIEATKHGGHQPLGIEGEIDGEWVLVDLGDAVVHIMQAQTREFYQLEKLWSHPEKYTRS